MAIGTTPIIPLYRVQPDPNARFQRFGVNDSQLFGKPLVETAPAARAAQPRPVVATATKAQAQEVPGATHAAAEALQGLGKQQTVSPALNTSAAYTGTGGKPTESKPGSSLNLMA